jgi:hypothetical protein
MLVTLATVATNDILIIFFQEYYKKLLSERDTYMVILVI